MVVQKNVHFLLHSGLLVSIRQHADLPAESVAPSIICRAQSILSRHYELVPAPDPNGMSNKVETRIEVYVLA